MKEIGAGMDNPYSPENIKKHGKDRPSKSHFQRELEAKMKERKQKGLATDVTSESSALGSDGDEIPSDDDLLGDFKTTSTAQRKSPFQPGKLPAANRGEEKKQASSPKLSAHEILFGKKSSMDDEEDTDDSDDSEMDAPNYLLMTMKKPWKPAASPRNTKSRALESLNEDDEGDSDKKPWQPPNFRKSPLSGDGPGLEKISRPKSPGVHGRTPHSYDSVDGKDKNELSAPGSRWLKKGGGDAVDSARPLPSPRGRNKAPCINDKPAPSPRRKTFMSKLAASSHRSRDSGTPRKSSNQSDHSGDMMDDIDGNWKSPLYRSGGGQDERKSPVQKFMKGQSDERKSPSYKSEERKSPSVLSRSSSEEQTSPRQNRRFMKASSSERKSPFDGQHSSNANRKSPFSSDRFARNEKEQSQGRKSPCQGKKPLSNGDKGSLEERRGSTEDRSSPVRRRSVLDMMTEDPGEKPRQHQTSRHRRSDSDSDDENRKTSPLRQDHRQRKSPFYEDDRQRKSSFHEDERQRKSSFRENDRQRKSPFLEDDRQRKSPFHEDDRQRKSPFREDDRQRKSPFREDGRQRKSPFHEDKGEKAGVWSDRRKPSLRKTSREDSDEEDMWSRRRKNESPTNSKKSPFREDEGEKAGVWSDRRKPSLRKTSHEDSDEEDMWSRRRKNESPAHSKTQQRRFVGWDDDEDEDRVKRVAGREKGESRRARNKGVDDDVTSVCDDVEEDPTMKRRPTKESEELKKRQPKHQTKEKQFLDDIIDSVSEEQQRTMEYIEPDKEDKGMEERRSKTVRHKPKPRYVRPLVETFPTTPPDTPSSFDSTRNIRTAVFQEWYAARLDTKKKELREKKQKEKEEEKKQEKLKEDKLRDAKETYNAWMEKKESSKDETIQKRREERKKAKEEEEDKMKKKRDAEKTFETWKKQKDEVLKEQNHSKKETEKKKVTEEEKKTDVKTREAEKRYKKWKQVKEGKIQTEKQKDADVKRKKYFEDKKAQRQREKEAEERYITWIKKKEDGGQQRQQKHLQLDEYDSPRPAWSPASRTIPFGR